MTSPSPVELVARLNIDNIHGETMGMQISRYKVERFEAASMIEALLAEVNELIEEKKALRDEYSLYRMSHDEQTFTRGYAAGLEAGAKLVEENQEVVNGNNERFLRPRKYGDLMSTAFAAAIRALAIPEEG